MKILNTEPNRFSEKSKKHLRSIGEVVDFSGEAEELKGALYDADVVLIGLKYHFNINLLQHAKNLKYIVTPTTGLNHIDLEEAERLKIKVLSLKGETKFLETVTATAELSWSLLLSLVRKINSASISVNSGIWNRDLFKGNELKGKTLGVFGLGRLGKMVANYGLAFGMKVLAYDPYIETLSTNRISLVQKNDLFSQSDIITFHIPLNSETDGLIDTTSFNLMKEGVIIINTSRGEILNEGALLKNLECGKVAMAGLDVLSSEYGSGENWMVHDRLIRYAQTNNNILITPHIGGATKESVEAANEFIIEKLAAHLQ